VANETIVQVEDAILVKLDLAPIGPVGGAGYARIVDSYQGELEDEDLSRVLRLFPAVLVVYDSSRYTKSAKGVYDETMCFLVVVASRNLRGEKAQRRGDVEMTGTDQMLRDIRGLIANKSLGLDVGPPEPVAERFVVNTREASIYEAVYELSVDFEQV
jgi:phage gp37-like protein